MTALVASALPGPGSSVLATSVCIKGELPVGESITTRLVVREKRADSGVVVLDGQCVDPAGRIVATAILEVRAPTTRQHRQLAEHRLEGLLERCRVLEPMLMGVVHPCSVEALAGAVDAAKAGLIKPVLFGPPDETRRIADSAHLDIAGFQIVPADGPEDSALKAAMAAGAGDVAALM
jgi:phosphate acetyltransferase/phosphate butyryltransferase